MSVITFLTKIIKKGTSYDNSITHGFSQSGLDWVKY